MITQLMPDREAIYLSRSNWRVTGLSLGCSANDVFCPHLQGTLSPALGNLSELYILDIQVTSHLQCCRHRHIAVCCYIMGLTQGKLRALAIKLHCILVMSEHCGDGQAALHALTPWSQSCRGMG